MTRRLVQLIPTAGVGGAEVLALRLSAALRSRGWDTSLWFLGGPGPISARAEALGLPTLHLHRAGRWDVGLVRRLRQALRDHQVDLLHSHLTTGLLWSAPAVAGLRCVVVHTVHGAEPTPSARTLRYLCALRADAMIACAPSVRDALLDAAPPPCELSTIANGVDIPEVPAACEGRPAQVACVARMVEGKGHRDLLHAMAQLPTTSRPTLHLIGGGPLSSAIKAQCHQARLSPWVRMHGDVEDPGAILQHMDGFVLASLAEALPLAALEAAAIGLPLILSDVGDTSRLVSRGGGWTVPPGRPDRLAARLDTLSAMPPAARRAMGGRARAHVRASFSLGALTDQHERLYLRHLHATA